MPCVDKKDLIYNIKELPETFSIAAGDMLVVETDDGTNIMDFNNFVIGLDNTTFGTTITQHSSDLNNLYSEFETLSTEVETQVAEISSNVGFGDDTALLAESGYQKLPSGLIMQWGVSERTNARQKKKKLLSLSRFQQHV